MPPMLTFSWLEYNMYNLLVARAPHASLINLLRARLSYVSYINLSIAKGIFYYPPPPPPLRATVSHVLRVQLL